MEGLTRELVRRGRTVCFIKHTHEQALLDGADTDTERLRKAGARTAILAGEASTIVFKEGGNESLEHLAHRDAAAEDIVLTEGFKEAEGAKIAIAGGDLDIATLEGLIAVVGDAPEGYDGKTFRADDVPGLCDAIEDALTEDCGRWATSLAVDGRQITLNAFVQEIMASGLVGMATALEGVEGGTTFEVRCRRIKKLQSTDDR